MKTILFLNTGVGKNLGDRAMLMNVARQVRSARPDWKLLVSANTPQHLVDELSLERTSFLIDCWGRWQSIRNTRLVPHCAVRIVRTAYEWLLTPTLAVLVLICMLTGWRPLRNRTEGQFIDSMVRADAIWLSGGGYLTDQGMFECRALLLTTLFASLLGKPVVMSGQGLGPFSTRMTRTLVRYVAQRAVAIGLRDSGRAIELIASLGVDTKHAKTISDDALTLPAFNRKALKPKTIGIHWRVSPHQGETDRVQGILERTLDQLAAQGWSIRLFVFHRNPAYEKTIYLDWTARRHWADVEIVESEDPRDLRGRLEECAVAIGMAYHFSVFALSANIPTLGLWHNCYYKDKIEGLFNAFGHIDRALDDRKITPETLLQHIKALADSPRAECAAEQNDLAKRHENWIAHLIEVLDR